MLDLIQEFDAMTEKILIIDDDVDTLRLVGLMLQRQGYQISAATNGEQGLAKAFEDIPDIILLDVMMPNMDGFEVTRRLRKNPATKSIPILMFTAKSQLDDKVIGFEAGADDYLTKPTHPAELQAHVKALLGKTEPKKNKEAPAVLPEQRGRVIGVLAARGGLGVSSVATNLAAGLFNRTQSNVILAELTPGKGTIGAELGTTGQKGLNEILSDSPAEITREKVQSVLIPHGSGLKLLLASENPRDIYLTSEVDHYEILISRLSGLARFIVLDLGTGLPPFVQSILPLCNDRIVVVEGALNTINQTKLMIDEIIKLGIDSSGILVILNNRVRSENQIPWMETQQKLEHLIAATITPAPELFLSAMRTHTPPVVYQPTSFAAQQFLKFADLILEREKGK
jgi:CheY-like chemotaxis protein/MinD-like ATPase involved in chromosome partitioning or flagellar assembly